MMGRIVGGWDDWSRCDELFDLKASGLVEVVIDCSANGVGVDAELAGDVDLSQAFFGKGSFDATSGWRLFFRAGHGRDSH